MEINLDTYLDLAIDTFEQFGLVPENATTKADSDHLFLNPDMSTLDAELDVNSLTSWDFLGYDDLLEEGSRLISSLESSSSSSYILSELRENGRSEVQAAFDKHAFVRQVSNCSIQSESIDASASASTSTTTMALDSIECRKNRTAALHRYRLKKAKRCGLSESMVQSILENDNNAAATLWKSCSFRKVKYVRRSLVACQRPRVQGRFIKVDS